MTQLAHDNEHGNFNQYGKYRHRTIATHTILPEEEFFDTIEHIAFDDLVDDLMDAVHPESVSDVYDINLS